MQQDVEMGVTGGSQRNSPIGTPSVSHNKFVSSGLMGSIKTALSDPELEATLNTVPFIFGASQKLNITSTVLVAGVALILCFVFLLQVAGFTMNIWTDIMAFIVPAYASYKAIGTEDKNDDTHWLTYWVIYAFLKIIEELLFLETLIPFYFLVKLAFLYVCAFKKGAGFIFKMVIEPAIKPYEARIDAQVSQVAGKVSEAEQSLQNVVMHHSGATA